MPGQQIFGALQSIRGAATWPADVYDLAGVPIELPNGIGRAVVAFRVTYGGVPAGSITPQLQGSLDALSWAPILNATPGAQAGSTAAGSALLGGGGSSNTVDLTGFRFLRLVVNEAAGPAQGDIVDCTFCADF